MLTATQINNAKPKNRLYRLSDSNGLAIEITPSGSKYWRYRYRFNNNPSMISLGKYPKIGLKDARILRDDYRDLIVNGVNPSEHKAFERFSQQLDNEKKTTFGDIFNQWHEQNMSSWSAKHAKKVAHQCDKHLLPYLKNKPINNISAQDMLWIFKKIESQGVIETLEKVRGYASRVFKYAVGLGLLSIDPTRDLPKDIFKKKVVTNFAHTTDPVELASILRKIDKFNGTMQVGVALKIIPHVFLRPTELVETIWSEVDFENKQIKIPKGRMKMSSIHIVPLSPYVLDLLQQMHSVSGDGEFVFPGIRDSKKCITPDSLRTGLRRMGIDKDILTTHGFRHTASTLLNEQGFNSDAVEKQLSHTERNKIRGIYNHAQYLPERREMMDKWSEYLDRIKREK